VPVATCPKSQISASEWNHYSGIKDSNLMMNKMLGDLRRIRKAGGMYLGIFDPMILKSSGAMDLPVKFAVELDSIGIWRTSTKNVIERYAGWRGLRVGSSEVTGERIRLALSNEGKINLTNVVYDVYLPDIFSDVEITSSFIGSNPTNVSWNSKTGTCTFTIPEIGPRQNLEIYLDLTIDESKRRIVQPDSSQVPADKMKNEKTDNSQGKSK